jgi:hypothetical protein
MTPLLSKESLELIETIASCTWTMWCPQQFKNTYVEEKPITYPKVSLVIK